MYLELSEEEAHMLILKAMNLDGDAQLRSRAGLHVLTTPHKIVFLPRGEKESLFAVQKELPQEEPPDECFIVDGVLDDGIAQIEEDLDGT